MTPPLHVRVPGSTSNLGSGFDVLGLALSVWLDVRIVDTRTDRHALVDCSGTAREWPSDGSNLLFRGYDLARERRGLPPRHVAFRVDSELPLSRGLGSSAAAIAAGLWLGARDEAQRAPGVHGAAIDTRGDGARGEDSSTDDAERLALARLAHGLEGHPDNAFPSLFGGLVAALEGAAGLQPKSLPVHADWRFAVAWSEQRLSTAEARQALPAEVPHALAVRQNRRLLTLLEGLRTGDSERLAAGGEDELHVPYRLPLIQGGAAALDAARDAGAGLATISGSGSTLFAIADAERIGGVVEALGAELTRATGSCVAREVDVVHRPLPPSASAD